MFYQVILVFGFAFCGRYFFSQLMYFSAGMHRFCIAQAPISAYTEFYTAIVCGARLPDSDDFQTLSRTGLLHIIVVSGSHLVFLGQLLRLCYRGRYSFLLQASVLFIFVAACELQAPALRAWFFVILVGISERLKLFNTSAQNILLSVGLCVVLDPETYFSFSLPMSWLACLGIQLGRNSFTQSLYCYFFLQPVFLNLSWVGLWTIAVNAFLTPLVCFLLFPLSLAAVVFHPAHLLVDPLWELLLKTTSVLASVLPRERAIEGTVGRLLLWLLPLTINLCCLVWRNRRVQR